MKDLFPTQEDYVKASMLEIMGTYQQNKSGVSAFVRSIKTDNTHLQSVKKEVLNELRY